MQHLVIKPGELTLNQLREVNRHRVQVSLDDCWRILK